MYDIAVTLFDIIDVNDTVTKPPVQNASTVNGTTIGDVFFANDDITSTANQMLSTYGDNPDASRHIYLAIRVLLGTVIMTINGLLIYCIWHFPYLHTPTNTLVVNLCIADFLAGCRQFLAIATVYSIGHSSWAKVCLAGEMITLFSVGGNIWVIFGISIDSCLYICKPMYYNNWVTIGRIRKIMVILWAYIITVATITLLKFNHLDIGMPCRTIIILDPMVYNILFFPQFICLITGSVLCYVTIAMVAWHQKKRCRQQITAAGAPTTNATPNATTNAADWKIVKMMALVPGVYLLSIFPAAVFGFFNTRIGRENIVSVGRVATIMWQIQCWVNPLIFAWKNENFRRAIKTVLPIHSQRIHNHTEPGAA